MQAAAPWMRRAPGANEAYLAAADLAELYDPADSVPGRRLLAAARTAPASPVAMIAFQAARQRGDMDLAMAMLDSLESRGEAPAWQPMMRLTMLAATGRPDSAMAWAPAMPEARDRAMLLSYVAAAPFVPVDTTVLAPARAALDQVPVDGDGSGALVLAYLKGLSDLRLGRAESAMSHAALLNAAADTLSDALAGSARAWARSIHATAALEDDDPAAALDALGAVDGPTTIDHAEGFFTDRTRERYLLGTLLLAAGRPDEAVRWLDHGVKGGTGGILYLPMSRLRLGEAHEMAGRGEQALAVYGEFLRYFAHAEPSMQPYVRQARTALGRLSGEGQ